MRHYFSSQVSLISLASVILLSACGGGGSDSSAPVTQNPTPPTVTNNTPTVSSPIPDQTAQVGFEQSIDVSQNGTTFSDADGDALSLTVSLSPPLGLTVDSGTIRGVPNATGDITVTVEATDPAGASVFDSFILSVGVDQNAVQSRFGNAINLLTIANYANQPVPDYIGPKLENGNPVTDAGATLGRVLFYDAALSIDNSISCSSCHVQANGFSDLNRISNGVGSGQTGRHSMRLINGGFAHDGPGGGASTQFWDQRAATHEEQETMPIRDANEHGFSGENGAPDFDALITKLEAIDYYEELFRFAFLDPEITEERIGQALAQFTKSIQSFDSRFDEGLAQTGNINANFPNFTAQENQGKNNFRGQGTGLNCAACHQPPEFTIQTGPNRGHNGVVGDARDPLGFDFTNTRSPSLRDLVNANGDLNGPLMHDGSLTSLHAMLDHYSNIPTPGGEPARTDFLNTLDPRLRDGNQAEQFNLSQNEKDAIEAFLRTLSGTSVYTDAKWSDPF